MKRPVVWVTLGYLIGIIWGLYFKQISIVIFFAVVIWIVLKMLKFVGAHDCTRGFNHEPLQIILLICTILLGLLCVTYKNHKIQSTYSKLENRNLEIIGTVISNKEQGDYYNLYKIKIDKAFNNKTEIEGIKGIKVIVYMHKNINELQYGNKIHFNGQFAIPTQRRNYKGFNYRQYLSSQNIFVIIKADLKQNKIIKQNNINPIFRLSNNLKLKIISNVNKVFPKEQAGVLIGMLIGETDYIR